MSTFTHIKRDDGFGAQFFTIIITFLYCKLNNLNYCYRPFYSMHHNYSNDTNFLYKKETLINFLTNVELATEDTNIIDWKTCYDCFISNFQNKILYKNLNIIKSIFNQNKKKAFNNDYFNVAIHIRVINNPDIMFFEKTYNQSQINKEIDWFKNCKLYSIEKYVKIKEYIKNTYSNKKLLFHIYSQLKETPGNINDFDNLKCKSTIFHFDEPIENTFVEMVHSDILVMSISCFSYSAAFLNEGTVFFPKTFHHRPLPKWYIF